MTEFVAQLVGLVRPHLGPAAPRFVTAQLRTVSGDREPTAHDLPLIADAFHRKASGLIGSAAAEQLRASLLELAELLSAPPVAAPVEVPPALAARAEAFGGVVQPDGRIGARPRLGTGHKL